MRIELYPIGEAGPHKLELAVRERELGSLEVRLEQEGGAWQGEIEVGGGLGRIRQANRTMEYAAALAGELYRFARPERRGERGVQAAGGELPTDGEIRAPMPGQVLRVPVSLGQAVEAGEVLAALESMKMELTVAAPAPGVVTAIHCAPGALTELDAPLVRLAPPGTGALPETARA
ncbi:MAG: biotin/lipoyl-binding protein, partial [Armatimonadetes bacterium]|nr:biotin/lipoyl-binding protein [Armatimonadota bacterium]